MTDTADRPDSSVEPTQNDQPQAPEEAAEALLAEPLEMPAPSPAPAGFRFPTDAELMDGPNPLTDPDEDDGDAGGEDESGCDVRVWDALTRSVPVKVEEGRVGESAGDGIGGV